MELSADEFQAAFASAIGIENFDPSTYFPANPRCERTSEGGGEGEAEGCA